MNASSEILPRRGGAIRWLGDVERREAARAAFQGLVLGSLILLAVDLLEIGAEQGWWGDWNAVTATAVPQPILPPAVRTGAPLPPADTRRLVTTDEDKLRLPMRFTLEAGVLKAAGSIEAGTALRFEAELKALGDNVTTVSLDSPGGSLDDALAMARTIRERGLSTTVADGALCASSCPLVFAGGKKRLAGETAVFGLHQFYVATGTSTAPAQAMADAQMTTARIVRYLAEMGVDPALWLHALDTPPRALYYLSPQELSGYGLVTGAAVGVRR